jgi:hypothetical protein
MKARIVRGTVADIDLIGVGPPLVESITTDPLGMAW